METILIVDDSKESRALLSLILQKEGFHLLEAGDGSQVPTICQQQQPDLILLDILMPGKDGFETCKELKASSETENIPVIFLSAKDDATDKVKGLVLGAVDYITKPYDKAEVVARVKTQLKIHALTEELFESNRILQVKQAKLEEDLAAAAHIQKALIPVAPPELKDFAFSWQFIPSDLSGGDIFNIHVIDDQTLIVYLIDVSGHGVPAAMVTVSITQSLQLSGQLIFRKDVAQHGKKAIRSPSAVLSKLNEEYPLERFDKYFTISYLIIDRVTGIIRYSNAGHPPPLLLRASGALEKLDEGGPMIGLGDLLPFKEGELHIAKGDRLFLHTDGITEHCRGQEFYGSKRLSEELIRTQDLPLGKACKVIVEHVLDFENGLKPLDDITLVALEYFG